MCLNFNKSEYVYADKGYAYKKRVYRLGSFETCVLESIKSVALKLLARMIILFCFWNS